LRKLVRRKALGKTIERPEQAEDRSNVIDLMEALRKSLKGGRSAARKTTAARKIKARQTRRSNRRKAG
jgi:non-homologous end joining protein Ku